MLGARRDGAPAGRQRPGIGQHAGWPGGALEPPHEPAPVAVAPIAVEFGARARPEGAPAVAGIAAIVDDGGDVAAAIRRGRLDPEGDVRGAHGVHARAPVAAHSLTPVCVPLQEDTTAHGTPRHDGLVRDFEDSTLWRVSEFERLRQQTGSSGFVRLNGPTVLPTTLLADLRRLDAGPASGDMPEV